VAGYLLKPDGLSDGPPNVLFKNRRPTRDLLEANVRALITVNLNCDMPNVQYGNGCRYILVPPGVDYQTGRESAKDRDFKTAAEKCGLKGLQWVYLPNVWVK
jgi:hypothetical protein